ncbi:MAG TPA: amino acid adenylation domain-containing protein [Actinocrinis sp.]|uniref:non-ribosomal peptide synthetase n=1 Tax=Actinocrinis sp. TaxID=1920516 RepID=UPI002DDD77D0|nr:amino acid adenylation domain-containing protein [Actinocrinis sp.]HEV2345833.1 amino acid adenylation domain-containing protein [Actinocrinis sp.]
MTVQPPRTAPADAPVADSAVSPAQQGLWLVNELYPESSLYNIFCSVRLLGRVELPALRSAVQRVVDRHEALRTTFPADQGRPLRRVAERLDVALPLIDLSSTPPAQRPDQARRLVQRWSESPFDLGAGPLLRVQAVRLGPDEHLLCLALHHIVCDGQSITVFFDELAQFYAQECGADPQAAVPPLAAQYRDYVAWRREQAADTDQIAWWRSYLSGAPDVLTVPTDRPRPALRGTGGATTLFDLPAALMADAAVLARRRRMSPFMVLLGAFAALLSRLSGVGDLLIGVPVTDRPLPEFEPLIGLFVDTLPVRVRLSPGDTFEQLLHGVRQSVLDALSHQGVSFEQLVEQLRPDRSPGHTPLVQVSFSADLNPFATPRFAGLDAELLLPRPTTAKFDLDMSINTATDGTDGFVGMLTYSTELFDAGSIESFVERFRRFVAVGVAEPQRPLYTLPLLDERERLAVLDHWSRGAPTRAAEPLTHEVFAGQAAATPDAIAVSAGGVEVSYAELDDRSDRIARRLHAAGVGPDDLVGVLLERSVDLTAALLGILKAGAAYLPLSQTHPPAYLARLVAAARARHVVAAPELAHRLAEADAAVLTPAELLRPVPLPWTPLRRADPDNLAYVLFTSGSTGEPKGVAITHRSLSNLVATMRELYQVTAGDRVLQFANIGFDVTVEETFPTWAAGACLVLSPEPSPGPDELIELMARERVSFTVLTSSYWRRWVTGARSRGVHPAPALRMVAIGAEPVDADAVRIWQQDTGLPVMNAYGLTETTVNATATMLDDPFIGDRVPIGRPIDGAEAYVLDTELNPQPAGVAGELYIGGDCLARGYLGRPDLTAARFVPHPFSRVPGARLHRTGDRARWWPGGNLEVLGRLDGQLKVRGYRIEPGHIEAVLCSHPAVSAAAVAVRSGTDGHERLIGYVVTSGTDVPADLRGHIAGRLPAYLVPSALVAIKEIPRNANGKADPRALPDPVGPTAQAVPARTDLERLLADVWQRALDLPAVGVDDNFFERGGTSLVLASVLSRLNEALGRRLPLVTLYEFPTIASLAQHLSADPRDDPAVERRDPRADRLRAGRARLADRRRERG